MSSDHSDNFTQYDVVLYEGHPIERLYESIAEITQDPLDLRIKKGVAPTEDEWVTTYLVSFKVKNDVNTLD